MKFAYWSPGEPIANGVAPVPVFNGVDLVYFFLAHVVGGGSGIFKAEESLWVPDELMRNRALADG